MTEDFTLTLRDGLTIYYVVHDLSNNTVWDQDDNEFRALVAAASPAIPAPATSVFGGGRFATYNARIELEDVHNGTQKSFHVAAYRQAGGAPDPLTDRPAGYLNITIERGRLKIAYFDVQDLIEQTGSGSELVNQDYGGPNNLCYTLNGVPVDNAEILIYREKDYEDCNRSTENVVAASRTDAFGAWVKAVMLDPGRYVVQFYKQEVSGPDAFLLVVSQDPDEISVTPINVPSCGVLPPPPPPDPCPPQETEGLDEFGGDGLVLVDQDYGGTNSLCYLIDGTPVAGAEILLFDAASYNAGNRQNTYAIAASRQKSDGAWELPVKLDPGEYVIQFHRRGVAGPDAYPLTVTA